MHEEWPKFDHKPAIMRAFKSADLDSDGYIRGAEEFELMIRGLTFFNNLWHHFESFDKDDDHRLDEDEFVAGVATLAHPSDHRAWGSLCASLGARPIGVDEAKTEFALLAGGNGHVLFYQFCAWCFSKYTEPLQTGYWRDRTVLKSVGADADSDANNATARRVAKRQMSQAASAAVEPGAVPTLNFDGLAALCSATTRGVQVDDERQALGWHSPRMAFALGRVGVEAIELLPQVGGRLQKEAQREQQMRPTGERWQDVAERREQDSEQQRLSLLARVVAERQRLVTDGHAGLQPAPPSEIREAVAEPLHSGRRRLHVPKQPAEVAVQRLGPAVPSAPRTSRTPRMVTPRAKPDPKIVAVQHKISVRLKSALHGKSAGNLNLGSMHIGDVGANLLRVALQQTVDAAGGKALRLTAIHLNGCSLTAVGARHITAALKVAGGQLRHLNVSNNPDMRNGVFELARALPKTLRHLEFSAVGCTDDEMLAMAEALPGLSQLEDIACSGNPWVGQAGWVALAVALGGGKLPALRGFAADGCSTPREKLRRVGSQRGVRGHVAGGSHSP